MPLSVDTFRSLAQSSFFSSRDIIVEGDQGPKLGNLVFSSGKKVNNATMDAFKKALEAEHGVFGTHAFDSIVGTRQQMDKSLRAGDVTQALSQLETIKRHRFMGELNRQLDTDPKVQQLSQEVEVELRHLLHDHPLGDPPAFLENCRTQERLNQLVSATIDRTIETAKANVAARKGVAGQAVIPGRRDIDGPETAPDEPVGLRNLQTQKTFTRQGITFMRNATSVEDAIKAGTLGAGMRINRHATTPLLLEKLKTNGVEPGFFTHNDWSFEDTRGLMTDIWSPASHAKLNELLEQSPSLRAKRDGTPPASYRDLVMAAGRAHPAAIAAVAEFMLQHDLAIPDSAIAKAFKAKLPNINPANLFPADGSEPSAEQKALIARAKTELFLQIRDAVLAVHPKDDHDQPNPLYDKSPIFKHFSDRSIVKLDYNEGDRRVRWHKPSSGSFRLPERTGIKFGRFGGFFYRNYRVTTPDKASAGAVCEALANDITRILGVPAQELSLVRGEYSNGHPKLMLMAKFADGYHDLEEGSIEDGQAFARPGDPPLEDLGKYKALFLALADRDAVGSHGQNKGIVGGKFFAIDPGHSLEGNGPALEIHDDLSFRDTEPGTFEKRFINFSVFDDDTRFAKLQGVLKLRELVSPESTKLNDLFRSYKAEFNPNEPNISADEKKLRKAIIEKIDLMEAEFRTQIGTILHVFDQQLKLYDALASRGPQFQEQAIETISNLEKLTSPTTWKSPQGKIQLRHLAVESETRVPWEASVKEHGDLEYKTKGPLTPEARQRLTAFCAKADVMFFPNLEDDGCTITVTPSHQQAFFDALQEDNVAAETHPEEYAERHPAAQ